MGAPVARATFDAEMRRLLGLKFPPADLGTHWEALHDMPEPLLRAAVSEAQRDSDEFPSPRMLRVYADRLRSRVLPVGPEEDRSTPTEAARAIEVPQIGRVLRFPREWKYYCEDCSDTGWRSFVCGQDVVTAGTGDNQREFARHPWNGRTSCGKSAAHLPHGWSRPCECGETNPAVQRKRERDIQHATPRVRGRGDRDA